MKNISKSDLIKGNKAFEKHEKRDVMYTVASFLVRHFWGKPEKMADGLGVLLLTWNRAFYHYGGFNFDKLEDYLRKNMQILKGFRKRNILTLSKKDEDKIKQLFNTLLYALQARGKRSPVAVAKALHILAPNFFPIWDNKIARAYKCHWGTTKKAAGKYMSFCQKTKEIAKSVRHSFKKNKTLLKIIDEYNYAKYSGGWI